MAEARLLVAPPPVIPFPGGLFSYLEFRDSSDPHWQGGVGWEPEVPCRSGTGVITDPPCTYPSPEKDLDPNGVEPGAADPFTLYGHYTCAPVGWSRDEAQARARRDLEVHEEQGAEFRLQAQFMEGITNVAAGVSPVVALATLESNQADGVGVLHVTPAGATVLFQNFLLVREGDRVFTNLGTPVIVGHGYVDVAANGTPLTQGTYGIYLTPPVFGFRSTPFGADPQLDRENNILYAIAERTYLLGYDDCVVTMATFDADPS